MRPIQDSRISLVDGRFVASCKCGKVSSFSTKHSARKMLSNGLCRYCRPDYRSVKESEINIYRRQDGKWCSKCTGCGSEQSYTRKDHAKQSELNDWQCRKCVARAKGFSQNRSVGDKQRYFNKFSKSAKSRGLLWHLNVDEMFECFDGRCALTGWPISLDYADQTASLDRIDSNIGYVVGNIQWVHTMVNMCKNKYDQSKFIQMCLAVSNKEKW